nr:hypothetical protein [Tanacetum cinerariifolium]
MGVKSFGLGGDEVVREGQQRAASVMETIVSEPKGLGYGALRRWKIALREGHMASVFEVVKVLDSYQSLRDQRESTPATAETEGFFTELGAQVQMQGGLIRDHTVRLGELSPAMFERSLEHEQKRTTVRLGALWRPVLTLEAWAGRHVAARTPGDERSCYCFGAGEGP